MLPSASTVTSHCATKPNVWTTNYLQRPSAPPPPSPDSNLGSLQQTPRDERWIKGGDETEAYLNLIQMSDVELDCGRKTKGIVKTQKKYQMTNVVRQENGRMGEAVVIQRERVAQVPA